LANDPRIKRVLKRYRKGEQFVDSSIDVSGIDDKYLLEALRSSDETRLTSPQALDEFAIAYLGKGMQLERSRVLIWTRECAWV
jgi:hypothetical protein